MKLDGWAESVNENIDDYKEPEMRYMKYVKWPIVSDYSDSLRVELEAKTLIDRINQGELFTELANSYTEDPGSTILENWGWFDIDDSYYFYYTHKQFIVKLPENRGYIKLWPYKYYGKSGQSAHTTLMYDFIEESN